MVVFEKRHSVSLPLGFRWGGSQQGAVLGGGGRLYLNYHTLCIICILPNTSKTVDYILISLIIIIMGIFTHIIGALGSFTSSLAACLFLRAVKYACVNSIYIYAMLGFIQK